MNDPLDFELELCANTVITKKLYQSMKLTILLGTMGEFAQDCFPYLTAGQRELMISNTCDDCWNKFFPE